MSTNNKNTQTAVVNQPSKADLEILTLADLKKQASTLHVAGAHKLNKVNLVKAILKSQRAAAKVAGTPAATTPAASAKTARKTTTTPRANVVVAAKPTFALNAAQNKVLKNAEMSKSDKFRALQALGVPTAVIAKETLSRYSFVYQALQRKQEVATA